MIGHASLCAVGNVLINSRKKHVGSDAKRFADIVWIKGQIPRGVQKQFFKRRPIRSLKVVNSALSFGCPADS